jgi:hypothetical protein
MAYLCATQAEDLVNRSEVTVSFAKPAARPPVESLNDLLRGTVSREPLTTNAGPSLKPMPRAGFFEDYGSFSGVVRGRITALQVTWWDEELFKNPEETARFVQGLMTTINKSTWRHLPWSMIPGAPSVVLRVEHTDGTAGDWLVWYRWPVVYCVYRDGTDRRWFSEWRGSDSLRLECDRPQVLIQALASPDRETRLRALRRVGAAAPGQRAAGIAVVPLLREPEPRLRCRAAYALGAIREPEELVVTALLAVRDDEDPMVRQAVAAVLGKFPAQAKAVVPALIAALEDPSYEVRCDTLTSILFMIREADALPMPELQAALDRARGPKGEDLRSEAASVLEELHSRVSQRASLESNLRQIELAKRSWASEHGVTGSADVTEEDLIPYFNGFRSLSDFVRPVAMERYRINPYGVPAEAELTIDFQGLKKGTIIRLDEVMRSNESLERTGAAPVDPSLP